MVFSFDSTWELGGLFGEFVFRVRRCVIRSLSESIFRLVFFGLQTFRCLVQLFFLNYRVSCIDVVFYERKYKFRVESKDFMDWVFFVIGREFAICYFQGFYIWFLYIWVRLECGRLFFCFLYILIRERVGYVRGQSDQILMR